VNDYRCSLLADSCDVHDGVSVRQRRPVAGQGDCLGTATDQVGVTAPGRRRFRGRVRDELVQKAGEHGRSLVDSQHRRAALVHHPQTLGPEATSQRRRVAVACQTGRSVKRLHARTMHVNTQWRRFSSEIKHTRTATQQQRVTADRRDQQDSRHTCTYMSKLFPYKAYALTYAAYSLVDETRQWYKCRVHC